MWLGVILGILGTLILQMLIMAAWWYWMVKRSGEKPLAALQADFAQVRDSIRRAKS